ncbi:hypothetical protein ACNFJ7_00250 [Sphingomonas sp. HT-1]|uniref:hypothetical protein n=1 Tax=unclassified Sphingomonas TaxID=196159 RepID=UPI00128FBB64|nr:MULTISPECIES: hypothetical protein [unclassified Sphingomonas]
MTSAARLSRAAAGLRQLSCRSACAKVTQGQRFRHHILQRFDDWAAPRCPDALDPNFEDKGIAEHRDRFGVLAVCRRLSAQPSSHHASQKSPLSPRDREDPR